MLSHWIVKMTEADKLCLKQVVCDCYPGYVSKNLDSYRIPILHMVVIGIKMHAPCKK